MPRSLFFHVWRGGLLRWRPTPRHSGHFLNEINCKTTPVGIAIGQSVPQENNDTTNTPIANDWYFSRCMRQVRQAGGSDSALGGPELETGSGSVTCCSRVIRRRPTLDAVKGKLADRVGCHDGRGSRRRPPLPRRPHRAAHDRLDGGLSSRSLGPQILTRVIRKGMSALEPAAPPLVSRAVSV